MTLVATQYQATMASQRTSVEPEERLPEADAWQKERANRCRGKREVESIEIETFENSDAGSGPWVNFK